jgi:phosphoenolpyruvate carboxykinase (ATP)
MSGGYGKAQRFPIPVSRTLLTAIQTGELDKQPRKVHPIFGFEVPTSCPGVDAKFLEIPEGESVRALAEKFIANAKAWADRVDSQIIDLGGPRLSSSFSRSSSAASALL